MPPTAISLASTLAGVHDSRNSFSPSSSALVSGTTTGFSHSAARSNPAF